MTGAKKGEVIIFSYIVYKSKKHRDQVNAKVMKEMEKAYEKKKDDPMPFEMKRIAYGGFEMMVDL
jgi:alkaline phosphatase